MIKFVQEFRDIDEYRASNPNIFKIPFNSKNKYQVCRTFIFGKVATVAVGGKVVVVVDGIVRVF